MIFPVIHINGSAADDLIEQFSNAAASLARAATALQQAAPNGRDYYVSGDNALRQAQQEHADRLVKLREIRSDINAILENVCDQKAAREAARRS